MENSSENIELQKPSPLERVWVRSAWLRNKYLITGLAFLTWMFFMDRNDIPLQWKRIKELKALQQSEKNMNTQIAERKNELDQLKTNPATLEKYAREKYMMKKDNEDLYIISTAQ